MIKKIALIFALASMLGIATAHGPTVPPDPDDGGTCTCGWWQCALGVCAVSKAPTVTPVRCK